MNCKSCKADCVFRGEDSPKECRGFIPITNADHIRSMPDEELAELLYSRLNIDSERIPFCKGGAKCETMLANEVEIPAEMCQKCMLKWLQEPWEET